MKRLISTLLLAAFLTGTAFSANNATGSEEPLSYYNVREQLLESNSQLKTISINIEGAESTIRQIDNNVSISESFDAINAQISAINAAEMDAVASGNPLSPEELAANKAKIAQLQQQQSALLTSASQLYSTKDSLKTTVETLRYTKQSTTELLVYSAQTLISSQYQLQNQERLLAQTEEDLARQKKMTDALYRVGRATDFDLKSLSYQEDTLAHTRQTLERQKKALTSQLNLLLARDFETEITFAEFEPTEPKNQNGEPLSVADYQTELDTALAANIDIASQKYTWEQSERYTAAYREAEQQLYELRRQFKSDFYDAFYNVFDTEDALRLEKNTLEQKKEELHYAKLKFDYGYLSANDYAAAQSAVISQEIAVSDAEITHQNAVLKLECFRNGGWPKS